MKNLLQGQILSIMENIALNNKNDSYYVDLSIQDSLLNCKYFFQF